MQFPEFYLAFYWNFSFLAEQYYIDSLAKAASGVSHSLEMKYFEVSEEDLQQIVKAYANAKCVYLNDCDIHCSKPLDFSTKHTYKIEQLGFYGCGEEDRKSDWIADPSLFENIVKAISKCGLRDSLNYININNWKLKQSDVEKIFEKYGMKEIRINGRFLNDFLLSKITIKYLF